MGEPATKEVLSLDELEAAGGLRTGRKHILSILVENKPGVLTRIAGLFARRGFNIDTLAVGPTDDERISRITLTLDGAARAEVMQLCEIFRGKVVDVTKRSIVIELTGTYDKVNAFEQLVRPFGLIEMARTGEIAIARGRSET